MDGKSELGKLKLLKNVSEALKYNRKDSTSEKKERTYFIFFFIAPTNPQKLWITGTKFKSRQETIQGLIERNNEAQI